MLAQRLVDTKNMGYEEWLEYRRLGIGGSDVAAICQMSRYKSPMAVYLEKLDEASPLEDNSKMKAGRKLEPLIADWFAEDTGYKAWQQNAIFQHPEHDFMLANIDRWLPGQNAGLECKNTAEYCRNDWSGTQAPTEYILQCNHYMAVTGADRWFIAVLIGGWDFQWRVIERDDELIKNLITVEREFWTNHIKTKIPPAYSQQDTEYLSNQYPESISKSSIELPEEAYNSIQMLYQARAEKKDAMKREETAVNQIKGYMKNHELAYFQGELKFSWKTGKRSRTFRVIGGDE
ncbi:YqaJ viral recombinase family protein [Brevibacillus laterosporus]|uniref:YqaJ viral recombinase family nuclease n=1 Tax=Brevibacillus laterosporus TaxID=1465 RepID=UPI002E24A237|nr:YqaJ viral recombinase family protein [Brevibacillus laterosporus]